MQLRYVYRLSDGVFLAGGPCEPAYDPAVEGVVVLPRHPNPRAERYDGQGGIRPAAPEELTASDQANKQSLAAGMLDADKNLLAVAIWVAQRLNVPLATARQEIITIRRGL